MNVDKHNDYGYGKIYKGTCVGTVPSGSPILTTFGNTTRVGTY